MMYKCTLPCFGFKTMWFLFNKTLTHSYILFYLFIGKSQKCEYSQDHSKIMADGHQFFCSEPECNKVFETNKALADHSRLRWVCEFLSCSL